MRKQPAKKVLFCQAQYYALFNADPAGRAIATLGFARVACQSAIAKGFLERVLHLRDVAVIPCFIDHGAVSSAREDDADRGDSEEAAARGGRHPQRASASSIPSSHPIPWAVIENKSEREIADIFGRSTIVLSLPFLESFGLVPLEAMASGAIVVGFHGHGALEYATPENGFWFPSDHIEETADALAHVIRGLQARDPAILKMLETGHATAARYSKDAARDGLARLLRADDKLTAGPLRQDIMRRDPSTPAGTVHRLTLKSDVLADNFLRDPATRIDRCLRARTATRAAGCRCSSISSASPPADPRTPIGAISPRTFPSRRTV